MRIFRSLLAVVLMAAAGCLPCLAQQPGPTTLENLVNSPEDQDASAVTEAADSGPKRPAGTLFRPKDGVQHPDLDKAWAEYDGVVTKAAEGIKAAITKQFDAATAKGDLDAAEKWQVIGEKFEKSGELPTETETKAAVSTAVADYKKAKEELAKAYEAVVKALTMEKKIVEAKAARDEARGIEGGLGSLEDTRVAGERAGEQRAIKWSVLFRSRNPAHWNRKIDSEGSFAIPLKDAPAGVRYLRLKRESNDSVVIVGITNEQLGADGAIADSFGWVGSGFHNWNAYHLGIYGLNARTPGRQVAVVNLGGNGADRSGWGFGHKTFVDDRQYYSWAGNEIPPTSFEIAVKCGELTNAEKRHLLTK
jgi:hypothetical protein